MTATNSFRTRIIYDWGVRAFGVDHMGDRPARGLRLLEEAAEAAQALGSHPEQMHRVVDVVNARPVGALSQELGGVLNVAASIAYAVGYDFDLIWDTEIHRCLERDPAEFARRNAEKNALGLTGHVTAPKRARHTGAKARDHSALALGNNVPRRIDWQRMTDAEKAIHKCIELVEALGADPKLTHAVVALGEAKDRVADFIDGVNTFKDD